MTGQFPETVEAQILGMLLASCQRLQHDMGGLPGGEKLEGLITKWDSRLPTIYYLERNMKLAQEVLGQNKSAAVP